MPADALDLITIRGFKSIAAIEKLELRPINLVIGANGAGKSNFIGAFAFLREIREGRLQDRVAAAGGAEKILHFGSKFTPDVYFHISFQHGASQYQLNLAPAFDDILLPTIERVSSIEPYEDDLEPRQRRQEAGISSPDLMGNAKWVHERLGSWRIYHLHDTSTSSPLRKTGKVDDNRYLRPDGSNLAPFLYLLRETQAESYGLIRRTVQRVAPFFDDFRLEPLLRNPDSIKLEWSHRGSDQYFDVSSLSDGTLRFIVLATLFLQPKQFRPSVILVDEPELGLHPYAISLLASLIRQVSVETQVIVSSQSSLLLDHFTPDDVLVADRVGRSTEIRRLIAEDLSEWLNDYSLGQLWEKNEIGGRPVRG